MVFGRRKRSADEDPADQARSEQIQSANGLETGSDAGQSPDGMSGTGSSSTGPWDAGDVPESGISRVDLGGMQIPGGPGVDLRIDVDDQGAVVGATLVSTGGALQLGAYAAPRAGSIWQDVRLEIGKQIAEQGGQVADSDGPFGVELVAGLPSESGVVALRFLGVDGPRWFLRGMLSGQAAVDSAAAEPLLAAFREVVVVRGESAMPVRDPIPLVLPPDVVAQMEQSATEEGVPEPVIEPDMAVPAPAGWSPAGSSTTESPPTESPPTGSASSG